MQRHRRAAETARRSKNSSNEDYMRARKPSRRLSPRAVGAWAAVSVAAMLAFMVEIDAVSAATPQAANVVPALK
jgi:hypothetical protein